MLRKIGWLVVALAACGPQEASIDGAGDELDDTELIASELNAGVLLPFVNAADTTVVVLTHDVGVDTRAANGIVAARPFATVAALDAVPYVGPATLARLDQFASARAGSTSVTVEGVAFSAGEAQDVLTVVNGALLDQVSLTSSARTNIVSARPIASLTALAAVPYVGTATLSALRQWVFDHPQGVTPPASSCTASGGTYKTVTFTQTEECHAVDFLNRARYSEMKSLTDSARYLAYWSGSDGVYGARSGRWKSVADFAKRTGIGTTAIAGLKKDAATWVPGALSYDTVATTWANRAALINGPVGLDKVVITKVLPGTFDEAGYVWQCAEVRDAANAPSYINACLWQFNCISGPCWDGYPVGTTVNVQGKLKSATSPGFGGYRITIASAGLRIVQP